MPDLRHRPRRLRRTDSLRRLVRENEVTVNDLIYPMFVTEESESRPITSMPGIWRYTLDDLCREAEKVAEANLPGIMLFGIPLKKDAVGSEGYSPDGIVPKALSALRTRFGDSLLLIADVCLCEYTDHGHCGIIENKEVINDPTLELLAKSAVIYGKAGAHIVAPSDMMDGRVSAIRRALDSEDLSHLPIMAYSAKYASGYYGPFREAAGSAPQFGDRRAYQMDSPNRREALREMALDLEEGADILMVKPGLAYLDIVRDAREAFSAPIAVYNVSGEYSMVKAAAQQGWIDEARVVDETLIAFKRAGADIILTYHALDFAARHR